MSLDLAACSDGELAGLSLGGNQPAFAELMRRHREPIYRLIRAYVGDAEEALDITQDCFASSFQHLARYDAAKPLRAWLARIAINKSRDWQRRQRVRKILSFAAALPAGTIEKVGDDAPGPEAIIADRFQLDRVSEVVATLPTALKETLLLRTIEGLSQAETAEILAISEKAVETRLYRARLRLSEKLKSD